jgi:hypothetical protein
MRIISVIVIIIFLFLMTLGYYGYRQMTDPPQWYSEEESPQVRARLLIQSQKLHEQIAHGKIPAELSNDDLSGLILSEIKRYSKEGDEQPVKGIQTQINADHILIDLILDVHALDSERLDEGLSKRIQKLRTWLPRSTLEHLPIQLLLIPEKDGSVIRWHKDSILKVGLLQFPLNDVNGIAKHLKVVDFELQTDRILLK